MLNKNLVNIIPMVLLFISTILYWVFSAIIVNPIAIVLLLFVGITAFLKSKLLSIILSVLFSLLSVYMIFALFSEYHKFKHDDINGTKMLLSGLLYFTISLVSAIFVGINAIRNNPDQNDQS